MTSFVIVGAGLHGSALARELALRGARVTLVERGVPGAEASTAAAGMLVPAVESWIHQSADLPREIGATSLSLYPGWVQAIARESGQAVGLHLDGAVVVRGDPGPEPSWTLPDDQLAALEPSVVPAGGAWLSAQEGWLDPRELVPAVNVSAHRAGAVFRRGEVTAVREGSVEIRADTGRELIEGTVVVCAGAWTARVPGLEALPVKPIRGQVLALRPVGPVPSRVVFGKRCYLVPRLDGRVIVGSTMEDVGFTRGVTAEAIAGLHDAAASVCPGLAGAELIDAWSGFRPSSPDGLPLMGPWRGVWVSSGHHRNGILLAPWASSAMANALLGEAPLPAGLSPARFGSGG